MVCRAGANAADGGPTNLDYELLMVARKLERDAFDDWQRVSRSVLLAEGSR